MKEYNELVILQMNDSHAYLDLHDEYFWKDGKKVYRKVGGYGRIANYFDKITYTLMCYTLMYNTKVRI